MKEAYSKAVGQGAQLRSAEFGFGPDGRPMRVHWPDGTPATADEWAFQAFSLDGCCVAVAVYGAGDR